MTESLAISKLYESVRMSQAQVMEQTQFRGASLVVVGCGILLCLFDWIFAASDGSPNIVAPFAMLGFVSIVGGLIAYWRSKPTDGSPEDP